MSAAQEEKIKKKLFDEVVAYASELEQEENNEVINGIDDIVHKLMTGNFRDLGGLVAMRGFIYQYYVAMFYAVEMLYEKKDNWWNAIVLEYFDDVALVGEDKIRFIQVKTVREKTHNKHTLSDFTTRKKLVDPESERDRFNSWVEKNFLNFDYFLEDQNILDGVMGSESYSPEFEIITNSASVTLQDIDVFTFNTDFNIVDEISDSNKIKEKILKPIKLTSKTEVHFKDVARMDIDFYLKKLYINKFGSSVELCTDILRMIGEIIDVEDVRKPAITEYIFEMLFANVVKRCHNDNEDTLKKDNLILHKVELEKLFERWKVEIKESLSAASYYGTAFGLFEKATDNLKLYFVKEYPNLGLRNDLIETLGWFKQKTLSEFTDNPTYCISFLNRLFNTNNTLTTWDFEHPDSELFLRNSIKHIVYFLAFYTEKNSDFNEARLIFHAGESEIINSVLFSIYHARNQFSSTESKNRVVTTLFECEVSSEFENDIYCLVLGSKINNADELTSKIASKYLTNTVQKDEPTILEIPDKIHFVDIEQFESFFKGFQVEGITLESFQNHDFLRDWDDHITRIVTRE